MRRHARRIALALALDAAVLVPTLGACASGGTADGDPGDGSRAPQGVRATADDHLDVGDYDGALPLLQRELAANPGDAELQEKFLNTRRLAAQRHANAALREAGRGEPEAAERHLARARELAPELPLVIRATQELAPKIEGTRRAAQLKAAAAEVIDSDPEKAQDLLAEARKAAPDDTELVTMLRYATLSAEATRSARRAGDLWDRGDRRRAVAELRTAVLDGKPVRASEPVRRRIETDLLAESRGAGADLPRLRTLWRLAGDAALPDATTTTLRDRLVEKLLAKAGELSARGSVALAALCEIEAQSTGAKVAAPSAEKVRAASAITLAILPFDDDTRGAVDGARLARAIAERVTADAVRGSMLVRVTSELPATPGYPNLVVRGRVESQRMSGGRVGTESKKIRYETTKREVANPEADRIEAQIATARTDLAIAANAVADAQARLRRLEELAFAAPSAGQRPTAGEASYQTKLAAARADVDSAQRRADALRSDEAALRERYRQTPRTRSEPVFAETYLAVTTSMRTCQVAAQITITEGDRVLLEESISAAAEHRETTSPALREAGIPADPDETPNDAEMAARGADRFAGAAAARIREIAEDAARPLLLKGREMERAKDAAGAAETYALFLLSTPETATPERAAAARSIAELTGLRTALRTGYEPEEDR